MGLKMGIAEVITPSRELATSDIFNAISFFVANYVFLNVLNICPAFCVNADATQFACGGKSDETVEVLYLDDQVSSKKSRSLKASSSSESSGDGTVSYFIKFYLIISNGGHMSPPVHMLADDNMDAEELRVYKIQMLGIGTNLEQIFGSANQHPCVSAGAKLHRFAKTAQKSLIKHNDSILGVEIASEIHNPAFDADFALVVTLVIARTVERVFN
eukprot:gene11108-7905_t